MTVMELSNGLVYPAGEAEPDLFYYAPRAPGIASGGEGRRQFNLLAAGTVSFLQITGSWGLSAAGVAALKEELAGKLGRRAEALTLMPVPESVDGAALVMSDGADGETVLQQTKSSGVPPYHAAFNIMLDAAQVKTVQEALDGKRLLLALRYDITRRVPVTRVTAEHTATSEAREDSGPDGFCSTESGQAETTATRETTEEIEKLSVRLDAADWAAAR